MHCVRQPSEKVFRDAHALRSYLAPLRAKGMRLVTTNGCFDIVHSGHVRYMGEAAGLGDLLVVGVNADEVVTRLKGPGRPVRREDDRALVVAALGMVDAAFVFREDDPRAFLELLKPDIHVKGGDYTEDIIEREVVERNGGKVAIVSYCKGFSTTSVVTKIRASGQ
jgi:D-beta-D-heptose 7-phosphate kinase / D-beta-D-heptose 1-phosphate adenosyltransferase